MATHSNISSDAGGWVLVLFVYLIFIFRLPLYPFQIQIVNIYKRKTQKINYSKLTERTMALPGVVVIFLLVQGPASREKIWRERIMLMHEDECKLNKKYVWVAIQPKWKMLKSSKRNQDDSSESHR